MIFAGLDATRGGGQLVLVNGVAEAVESWFMYLNGQEAAPALYAANEAFAPAA